jgi:hypothetical protein
MMRGGRDLMLPVLMAGGVVKPVGIWMEECRGVGGGWSYVDGLGNS